MIPTNVQNYAEHFGGKYIIEKRDFAEQKIERWGSVLNLTRIYCDYESGQTDCL